MDSSRRAVEAYWRSRMIDGATSDEDKVTPVYKLEEICELLRSSHVSIVKEVSEYIFKRLDHKSPVVKQKALRLIKYAVGKSGVEFRREMQRHSAAIRHLFHYKGQVDPLKGDALNKAVRDTAHEAISAIFASEESKVSPAEDLNRRIEGFGNTNFEMPSDDRKSFLSEVVGIGSASIKQGLSSLTAAHSIRKNDTGTYKSPTLRRSLTTDMNSSDRYERGGEYNGETRMSSGYSSASSGTWGQDSNVNISEMNNRDSSSSRGGSKSREERLLETIVTPGGVRLQPTRDALHVFLLEASKLDAVALSRALETKLQSHLWQVRMKAVCVLESILRKKDDEHFEVIASYFSENKDSVVKCSESPQASLREKSMKVLCLIDGGSVAGTTNLPENPSIVKTEAPVVVQMPDLIDTGDSDDYFGQEESNKKQSEASGGNLITTETLVTNDLFGDSLISDISTNENKNEDPFAGVSFHTAENSEHVDLFSGLDVDDKKQGNLPANKHGPELVDLFGTSTELMQEQTGHDGHLQDLMAGMSINENNSDSKQQRIFSGTLPEATLGLGTQPSHQASKDALNGAFSSQMSGMNPNLMFPLGPMQYNVPSNIMLNQAFASNPMNYGAMGNFLAQQQLLAAMSNIQSIGNLGTQPDANLGNVVGNSMDGGYASPLPDIFHPNMPVQTHTTMMASSKKEETKAFDFISDHLSAARGSKRVI